ncbi:MAG: Bax protein [Alteromonadaceae bacterium]|jgi:Bax protein
MIKQRYITLSLAFRMLLSLLFIVSLIAPFYQSKVTDKLQPLDTKVNFSTKQHIIKTAKVIKLAEAPLHKVVLPDFANIGDVKEKKRQFFNYMKPAITSENNKITLIRAEILALKAKLLLEQGLSQEDKALFKKRLKQYKIKNKIKTKTKIQSANKNKKKQAQLSKIDELLARVDIVPSSLVLVQAANESAWGTSRFARVGLNFFGIWCYKKGCGMVPNSRDIDGKHEVEKFASVDDAVRRYLHNINTNQAYRVLRTIRAQLRAQKHPLTPKILATGLLPYSERGSDYVLEITSMIRHNQVYFDSPSKL